MKEAAMQGAARPKEKSAVVRFIMSKKIHRNWPLYVMLIPVVVYFAVFGYTVSLANFYGIASHERKHFGIAARITYGHI